MPTTMNETITREHYEARIETVKGFVFLHLSVSEWNKTTLKEIREDLRNYLIKAEEYGHDAIFMASDSLKSVRMWELVKPCFKLEQVEHEGEVLYLGSWITGE